MRDLVLIGTMILTFGAGCPPKPPTRPDAGPADLSVPRDLAPPPVGLTKCPTPSGAFTAGVCDGISTKGDGLPCVRCASAVGCVDQLAGVYCVTGGTCGDPLCTTAPFLRPNPEAGAAPPPAHPPATSKTRRRP
jgi:hypothetical protein